MEDDKLREALRKVNINASRDVKAASAFCESNSSEHRRIGDCIKEVSDCNICNMK